MGSFFPARYSAMNPQPRSFQEILQGILIDAPLGLASAARCFLGAGDRIGTGFDENTDKEKLPSAGDRETMVESYQGRREREKIAAPRPPIQHCAAMTDGAGNLKLLGIAMPRRTFDDSKAAAEPMFQRSHLYLPGQSPLGKGGAGWRLDHGPGPFYRRRWHPPKPLKPSS